MRFCFLNLRRCRDGEGLEPDSPTEASVLLLADLPNLDWGLYEVDVDDPVQDWSGAAAVDDELQALIISGRRYAPALALARHDLKRIFADRLPSQQEFAAAYAESIRTHLSQQAASGHHLVRCVADESCYLTRDEWYWVLKVGGEPPMVSWVSDDYFVYQSPDVHFDLPGERSRGCRTRG